MSTNIKALAILLAATLLAPAVIAQTDQTTTPSGGAQTEQGTKPSTTPSKTPSKHKVKKGKKMIKKGEKKMKKGEKEEKKGEKEIHKGKMEEKGETTTPSNAPSTPPSGGTQTNP